MLKFTTYPEQKADMERFASTYPTQDNYIAVERHNVKLIPKVQRICKFCHKDTRQTTFRSRPHIIPRFLGNGRGVSDFECDPCNFHFGRLESHFADFLGLAKSLHSVGSEKVSQFIPPQKGITAEIITTLENKGAISITDIDGKHFRFDPEKLSWQINYLKFPHTPINVYKSLLKIAFSVLPDAVVREYQVALDFLLEDKNPTAFSPFAKIMQLTTTFVTTKPFCIVFSRKDPEVKLPKHMVYLAFENLSYQFFLPYHAGDAHLDYTNRINVIYAPPLIFNEQQPQEEIKMQMLDLSERSQQKNVPGFLSFNTDEDFFKGTYDPNTHEFSAHPFSPLNITNVILTKDGKPRFLNLG